MTTIASGVIIKGKGEGIEAIMNDVINREIEIQRRKEAEQHKREMESLRVAIAQRDKVTEERHKVLGRKLAEYKAKPKPSLLREIKEFCIYVLAVIICIVRR